jgi:hypothetical protein
MVRRQSMSCRRSASVSASIHGADRGGITADIRAAGIGNMEDIAAVITGAMADMAAEAIISGRAVTAEVISGMEGAGMVMAATATIDTDSWSV